MLSSSDSNLFICYSALPGDTQDAPLPSDMGSVQRFYRAMHFSAKRGIAIACRLSVCPSVCLSVCL